MHSNALQVSLYLLGTVPFSLFFFAYFTVVCGWLRDPDDQPQWFRYMLSRTVPSYRERPPSMVVGVVFGGLLLAFFNSVPLLLIVLNPYGPQAVLVGIAYFLVEGAFLFPVVRAVLRERARNRGR
jgi:MFS family permease